MLESLLFGCFVDDALVCFFERPQSVFHVAKVALFDRRSVVGHIDFWLD
jgi:hypothetical protein